MGQRGTTPRLLSNAQQHATPDDVHAQQKPLDSPLCHGQRDPTISNGRAASCQDSQKNYFGTLTDATARALGRRSLTHVCEQPLAHKILTFEVQIVGIFHRATSDPRASHDL
jgi:hypothetical protein